MKLDQELIDAAIAQLEARYPGRGGLAAAAYTEGGTILTSVVFDPEWGGGGLCAETGALLEAHRRNERLTAIACVSRLSGDSPIVVATPCGICQERLFHWGGSVEVAVPRQGEGPIWQAKTLDEVQPYYWAKVFEGSEG